MSAKQIHTILLETRKFFGRYSGLSHPVRFCFVFFLNKAGVGKNTREEKEKGSERESKVETRTLLRNFYTLLETESRTSCMQGTCSIPESLPQPCITYILDYQMPLMHLLLFLSQELSF